MPQVGSHTPRPGTARGGSVAPRCRALVAGILLALACPARADESWITGFAVPDAAIPDDTVLQAELERAVDLRRRETFDRVLDARDPGELIEHATLTDVDFDHRSLGIDTLFVVGDELFAYLFRPENGWGSGGSRP